ATRQRTHECRVVTFPSLTSPLADPQSCCVASVDVLPFYRCPLHRERPRLEVPADQQLAIHPKLRFDAPALLRPQLAPEVCMIRLADEFKQHFTGLRSTRFCWLVAGRVKLVRHYSVGNPKSAESRLTS